MLCFFCIKHKSILHFYAYGWVPYDINILKDMKYVLFIGYYIIFIFKSTIDLE